ncbi:MAG: polysaccharide biosynthesis/export family protein, partial [Verrucomicrobiae bacterium]|nr:polysaccharide biosynthesis/export family protein [Verrucomicrobiae bacterium]
MKMKHAFAWIVSVALIVAMSGCAMFSGPSAKESPTTEKMDKSAAEKIRAGDEVLIRISGTGTSTDSVYSETVSEGGTISLPYLQGVAAVGKTPSQLSEELKKAYVDGGFFRDVNVTSSLKDRFFYIRGEVRNSGRFLWSSDITVMKAIATAGGFTDFANPRTVKISRNG